MPRLSFLSLFLMFVVIICGVYRVANQYQIIEKQVNKFDASSEDEHENIRVLQAEWAFLTSPARLEKIARDNFQLQPVDGSQTVALANIPVRATLDAQEVQTSVADADDTLKKFPQKLLPPGVTQGVSVASNDDTTTIAAAMPNAMPSAASQALPPIEATPISDQRAAR